MEKDNTNNDLAALNEMIDEAIKEEQVLAKREDELSLQSKQFAEYLAAKKHNDERLEVLWDMCKQFMVENHITEHENDYIKLKLTPSGKYRTEDVEAVDDSLCDIVKKLSNKKVKAYVELNGKLPEGVESTGYILRKTIKEKE